MFKIGEMERKWQNAGNAAQDKLRRGAMMMMGPFLEAMCSSDSVIYDF